MNVPSLAIYHLVRTRRPHHVPTGSKSNVTIAPPPTWISPIATYIICTNPRSGSWLLSEGLASTSVAGNPREWFNIGEEQRHRARWRMEHSTDLSYATYLELARTESTTSNGISGIKLHYYQFAEWQEKMASINGFCGLTAAKMMRRAFPDARYIWLRRRDKVRQAISLALASRTNEWWSIGGFRASKSSESTDDSEFDPHTVAHMEHVLEEDDSQWQTYFQDNTIAPLVIHYEDLVADYAGTIVSVLKWLRIPKADAVVVPRSRLNRQSNWRNEEWLIRYTAFKSEGGHLAPTQASVGTGGAKSDRAEKTLETVPDAWQQWVGQSKLLNTRDESIVEVLTKNGYSLASALAEVEKAASDQYLLGAARSRQRLQKGVSLLNALAQLARLDSGMKTVERRANVSCGEFRDRYYSANRPLVLTGLMTGWWAMTAWTPEYLKSIAGDQTVEVMMGREADPNYEMNGRAHRSKLRFADYIDMVYSGKVTNDYYLVANNGFFQRPEMQPLLKDFIAFPEYLNQTAANRQCFLWFGPAAPSRRCTTKPVTFS